VLVAVASTLALGCAAGAESQPVVSLSAKVAAHHGHSYKRPGYTSVQPVSTPEAAHWTVTDARAGIHRAREAAHRLAAERRREAEAKRHEAQSRKAAEREGEQHEVQPRETPSTCTNGTYVNSAGNTVCKPEESSTGPPAGATAECTDGTYSFSESRSGTCSSHDGVARWL
jgi:hypothetical protein